MAYQSTANGAAIAQKGWQRAILNCGDLDVHFTGIFDGRPELAAKWLARRHKKAGHFSVHDYNIKQAIAALDGPNRSAVVAELPPLRWSAEVVAAIIGNDLDAYRLLLVRKDVMAMHLDALNGCISEVWVKKAVLALDVGHTPADIAAAPIGGITMINGNASDYWRTWEDQFARLASHPDCRIREVGRLGMKNAQRNRERAAKQEYYEEVFGEA